MAAGNPNITEIGKKFTSEYQPENAGRKKNIFKEIQKDFDLSIDDTRQVIKDVLSMSIDDIVKLKDDKSEPAYRLAIASAVLGCIKSGNWTQINYMFDRLFGKATESHRFTDKNDNDLPVQIIIKDAEGIDIRSTSETQANIQQST